jgi:hypothetical protein
MTYDLDQAKQKVTDYSTQKWGRGPQNDTEWGAVAKGINYGDGIDDYELNQAYGNADAYATSIGAQPVSQQPAQQTPVQQAQATPLEAGSQVQQTSPIQQAFQGSLLNLINRSQQAPSLSDPTLKPQVDVFRSAQQRNAERMQQTAAERLAAQGLNSGGQGGAMDAAVSQIGAQRGLNEATFEAGLLGQEMDARRGDLMNALELARVSGDTHTAQALQRELSLLDLGLRGQGLDLQKQLGLGDLDLRGQAIQQQGQLGRGDLALRLLLGMQGNQLAYDQMGLGASQWLAQFNQNNFQNYMGGF